jgi:hypothetical protein
LDTCPEPLKVFTKYTLYWTQVSQFLKTTVFLFISAYSTVSIAKNKKETHMKKILLTLSFLFASMTFAKTINYDVFKTEKSVESVSSLNDLKVFDFKLTKVVSSKTITSKRCDTGSRARDRQFNCDVITTTKVKVAQVILGYRPTGTTDRHGEVTNGKKMSFVRFNVNLNDLTAHDLEILNSKRGLFTSKKKFVRFANELFEVNKIKTGYRTHLVSLIQK